MHQTSWNIFNELQTRVPEEKRINLDFQNPMIWEDLHNTCRRGFWWLESLRYFSVMIGYDSHELISSFRFWLQLKYIYGYDFLMLIGAELL